MKRSIFFHRFFSAVGITFLLVVLSAIGIIWVADPYDRLGNNWAGAYYDNDRFTKSRMLKSSGHDALLLGSSKVAYINPADLEGYNFFNAALVGSAPEEILTMVQQFGPGMKRVIIGLDFYMFNERESPLANPGNLRGDDVSVLAYLTNLTTLKMAFETLGKWFVGSPQKVLPNGQRNPAELMDADRSFSKPEYDKAIELLKNSHYRAFHFSERRLQILRDIKAFLIENNIPFSVFINPLNERILKLIRSLPAAVDFERFRREVKVIFPMAVDEADGIYSAPEFFFYSDPWHYRPSTGAALVNKLLLKEPSK